jgi:hypothetical protein
MLIIKRDYKHGNGDRYTVQSKEPSMGRGWKREDLPLETAQAAVLHYFGSGHDRTACKFCELIADQER